MSTVTKHRILGAIEAIAAVGNRPTVRHVRKRILDDNACAPSFREIQPVLRDWRERQHASRAVSRLFGAYQRLSPEQRLMFRRLQRRWDRRQSRSA